MKIERIWAVFFSPVKNTEKIVMAAAGAAAEKAGAPELRLFDMTNPQARAGSVCFGEGDLVFMAVPTYAGRVPNKLRPFIEEQIIGSGALGAALVTYGNRSFDDSLTELAELMREKGFTVVGGGAFVCQHAFAGKLAAGRPAAEDLTEAADLGRQIAGKVLEDRLTTPAFPGNCPVGPYYVPKGTDGKPAVFLKAKPKTDESRCIGCGLCVQRCPMGSIEEEKDFAVTGICIKCQACIAACPTGAKYMTDEAFLSHKQMLEENFADKRRENRLFY